MLEVTNLYLFVISGILLNLVPGPDSLYIMGISAKNGLKAGIVAALSIFSGTLVHIFAATFGLSAILASSVMAFTIVKIIGCLYLLYMGFSMLLSKEATSVENNAQEVPQKLFKIYYQGFLTNALNPKVALFFLAFVPQFIEPNATNKELAFLVLGFIFNFNGLIWGLILAYSSFLIGGKVKQSGILPKLIKKFAGLLFIYFGVKLAFSKQIN